jgi:glycosyltransferase involved in cell wall biosynthesis
LFGFGDARTHVVWNGVRLPLIDRRVQAARPDMRESLFGRSDVWVATLVGSITQRKDHELAIAVAERLVAQDPRWRILFVGASHRQGLRYENAVVRDSISQEERVFARHESSPARDAIRFVGERSDALELIADSDVLFSTSRHEGFPNVVLEAMAVGTPVVSTDYSDIQLILPQAWQVVASRDAAQLAQAVERARRERAALARVQRDWVEANASIERSADALLAVYAGYAGAAAPAAEPARTIQTR